MPVGATRPRPSSAGRLTRKGKTLPEVESEAGRLRMSPTAGRAANRTGSQRFQDAGAGRHHQAQEADALQVDQVKPLTHAGRTSALLTGARSPARSERQRRQPTRCRYSPRPEAPPQAPSNRHRRPERHRTAGLACLDPCKRTSAPGDVQTAQARKAGSRTTEQTSPGRATAQQRQPGRAAKAPWRFQSIEAGQGPERRARP